MRVTTDAKNASVLGSSSDSAISDSSVPVLSCGKASGATSERSAAESDTSRCDRSLYICSVLFSSCTGALTIQ